MFHGTNLSEQGPLMDQTSQTVELFGCSDAVYVNTPIILIPGPAPDTELRCTLLDEPAEPNTLHASRYKPSACLDM